MKKLDGLVGNIPKEEVLQNKMKGMCIQPSMKTAPLTTNPFGLCDALITPRGKAVRLGSVVTDPILAPPERPYPHRQANCLYSFNGSCKACVSRCPTGAITVEGHDKDKRFDSMHDLGAPAKGQEYGVKIVGWGLCQTRVPCEFEIPKPVRKEYARLRLPTIPKE